MIARRHAAARYVSARSYKSAGAVGAGFFRILQSLVDFRLARLPISNLQLKRAPATMFGWRGCAIVATKRSENWAVELVVPRLHCGPSSFQGPLFLPPPPDLDPPSESDVTIASTLSSEELRADAGGYDYGWPDATVAIADSRFVDLLNFAEINAVGYALVPTARGRALPQIDLVAEKAEPLREAFALFERWGAMSGVGSISVSIAPEKTGYTLLIGTDFRALRWRCCGFQNVASPETFGLTWAKTLDTRNDFVGSLQAYARNVVAPVFLGAAQLGRTGSGEIVATALPGVDPILLPGIGWDAPTRCAGREGTGSREDTGREGDAQPPDPMTIARERERRLHAIAPKTLYDLRHTKVGLTLRDRLAALGARDWQIGQAITNLGLRRLHANQASAQDEPDDRWEGIQALRLGQVELATSPVTLDSFETEEITDQIGLDAAFLLRRLDRLPGELGFAACQLALREGGHF